MTATASIVMVAAALALAGLVVLTGFYFLPEKVALLERTIVKRHRGKAERMPLTSVFTIKFQYHAVVGFVAVWEFIDTNGNSLMVDDAARGMKELKAALERELPEFSIADFERKLREGDVEDSIDVWSATN